MTYTGMPFIEEFGTGVGQGDVNADMDAFAAASLWLTNEGGGGIQFSTGITYLVGRQTLLGVTGQQWSYEPDPIIRVSGATKPIVIQGNGARFECVSGLRYGSFNPVSGAPTTPTLPYIVADARATPYIAMIDLQGCTGGISIRDLELDGSNEAVVLGGLWGDQGRQIPCSGIYLADNEGPCLVENVHAHHHCWDGAVIYDVADPGTDGGYACPTTFINFVAEYNARQGLSIVRGRGITIIRSKFNHTGRALVGGSPFFSPPGAGVDIEALDGELVRDVEFISCEFADNTGVGFISDTGDNGDIICRNCRFVGTSTVALWPNMPRMTFEDCLVLGPTVRFYDAADWKGAVRCVRTRFSYDEALSPTGTIYGADGGGGYLVDVNNNKAIFDDCDIEGSAAGPAYSSFYPNARLIDCRISDGTTYLTVARALYSGTSSIDVPNGVYWDTSEVHNGRLTVNGVLQRFGSSSGWAPGAVANGASVTRSVTVPMAATSDSVVAAVVAPPAGFALQAAITAANTMTATLTNVSGSSANPGTMTVHGRLLDA